MAESRWDRFHEARALTGEQALADEVVKTLVADLSGWPPPVERWTDEAVRARYEPVLRLDCPRPGATVLGTAFRLATWELERSYDALDDFARNDRAFAVAPGERDRLCLELLHRWLTDSMLELLEVTPLRRPVLIECLRRVEARLLGPG